MLTDHFAEIRDHFLAALDHDGLEAQLQYAAEHCAHVPGLQARLEAMLQAHHQSEGFLTCRSEEAREIGALAESIEAQIGPYKLLEPIGEGGFGVVYLAEQMEPVRRKVALKIVKPGMDTRQVVARFEAERQALARMDHPNIARILDAGVTPSGRPYFAMDLVVGVPITNYCDANHLPTRERLELFVAVCAAVQHAHRKGIIHRDLKPSNLMITLHDGRPVPKIIDFGIAKAIDCVLTEHTHFTAYGQIIGTPQYMSPEQAEMSGLDIDTRSDVYSLGVVLYELLTGTTPLEAERLRSAGFGEMQRLIRDEEPTTPSARLSTRGERATIVARDRSCDQRQLSRELQGELDWIVMKALDKDRARRYDSPADLAGDVQRYLRNEPVLAGPPSRWYRLRKLARRQRAVIAFAATVLVLLVGGIIGTTLGLWRARDAERTAIDDRIAAERAQQAEAAARLRTRAALDMLTDRLIGRTLLRERSSGAEEQRFLREIEMHYQAWVATSGDEASSHELQANGFRRIAQIRLRLGDLAGAETNCRQAIDLYQTLLEGAPTNSDYRRELARTYSDRGDIDYELGRHEATIAAYEASLSGWQILFASHEATRTERLDAASTQLYLGRMFRLTGRPWRAETALRGVLRDLDPSIGSPTNVDERRLHARCLDELARTLVAQDRLAEAEETYRAALAEWDRLIKEFPRDLVARRLREATQGGIALRLAARGEFAQAEALWRDVVAARRKQASESPGDAYLQEALSTRLLSLGKLLRQRGQQDAAQRILRESVDIYAGLMEEPSATPMLRNSFAQSLAELAETYAAQRRWQDGRDTVDRAAREIHQLLAASPQNRKYEQTLQKVLRAELGLFLELGDHSQAAARATQLANLRIASPRTINESAWRLAQCASSAMADPQLALKERLQQAWTYVRQGLDLLPRAAVREIHGQLFGPHYYVPDDAERNTSE